MRIVAELGQNTQGDVRLAHRMIDAAKQCGCDGVKVQAYDCSDFLPEGHPDWDMFAGNRLDWPEIAELRKHAGLIGLEFGGTPTSIAGVGLLARLQVDFLKNGSDFLLRHDLIEAMLATEIETWVSTGMATHDEAMGVPEGAYVMACTSLYPCPDDEAFIGRVRESELGEWWYDGYSDHTIGTVAAVVACARGAKMFEKHFTLDHTLPGPDHSFSADPSEMAALVRDVRRAERMSEWGLDDENPNRDRWRVTEGQPLRG